ncbi:two-component regulator propeller domain-containing protein [Bacteroides sp. 51]|uniref:two-component regulator propeller domain-containing protein n=1 Tax=Bacteroides sp. 51 TaxID=2302938 RepID=UPI0013D687C3|nr:two-component regulator propeller domain-containing protein [Bacteroides sp. 51]NDV82865.1 response regulator [Bacteroides sp. 51]
MEIEKHHLVKRLSLPFILVFLFLGTASAHSFRQYTAKDGLSNTVVASVYQDRNGLMWFGTNDGLNTYDGLRIQNFQTTEEQSYLTGHTIGDIFETENNIFWVLTNYGLNRIDHARQTVKTFEGFDLNVKIAVSSTHDIYIAKEDNSIFYYHAGEEAFQKIPVSELVYDAIVGMFIDQDQALWLFMEDGNHRCFSIQREGDEVKLIAQTAFKHQEAALWCFYEEGEIYFVDATLTLYEYSIADKTKYYIQDINHLITQNGDISSIIKHSGDFYVGFTNGGLIRIKNMPEHKNQFQIVDLAFRPGVLSLCKDMYQDIVWVGTNGEGVSMLFNEASSLAAVLSANLSSSMQTPITALYRDDKQTLWVGSAGNGIVSIHDYNPEQGTGSRSEFFLPYNSLLGSTSISAFAPSSKNLLWIGTENGLNYYSYQERRIKNLNVNADGKVLKQVSSVCEVNDTTLWVATAGEGLVKVHLVGTADSPIVASAKRVYAGDGSEAANMFTVAYREDERTVWFGTQGNGVYKVDSGSERMENFLFAKGENQPQNDIYSILKNSAGYWFATGEGLAGMVGTEKTVFDENNGFPHKTVHGILEDNNGNLWLSTNRGVVKFNMEKQTSHLCKQAEDKMITGFSDGACFKDPLTGMLLFGGENGLVTINENDFVQQDYTPEITFNGLSVFGKRCNIYDYLVTNRGRQTIRLNYDQNVFGVSFVANDYIDGKEYTYFYKLNEQGENWVDNGNTNSALFTYLASGKYTLSAKYRNNVTGKESPVYQVTIHIQPRWYQSWWAYVLYVLVAVGVLYIVRWGYVWHMNRRKVVLLAAMEQKFHESEARAKLGFFAGMSNELYGSLALIENSSDKILANSSVSEEVRKYITLIQNNSQQLKGFVCDLNELRTLEAGDKKYDIASLPVSELADALASAFVEQANDRKINYQIRIKNGLYWISDSYYLCRLIGNLLSDAFIHVQDRGMVSVDLRIKDAHLCIVVVYTGELPKLDMPVGEDFDYIQAIDLLEKEGSADSSTFNSRLLAINCAIAKDLKGSVMVEGEEGHVVYTVTLPEYLPGLSDDEVEEGSEQLPSISLPKKYDLCEPVKTKHSANKGSILLVDDNENIQCLFTDLLHNTYNVEAVADSEGVIDKLQSGKYDLLIVKATMPVISGIELTRMIKADTAVSHIPCVLLASSNKGEERNAAIEAGADLYMPKPFDMEALQKEIAGLLQYKKVQQYFNSTEYKAFELGDEHFATPEDKTFFEQMIGLIDANIKDTELSVEMISEKMGCTTQEFYSRLIGITRKTPNEIIRAYRLSVAERMLVSTNLPVEEIINRIGIGSRSSFFKSFMQVHGMTPKNYREQQKKALLRTLF